MVKESRLFPLGLELTSMERRWIPRTLTAFSRKTMAWRLGRLLRARRIDVALAEYATFATDVIHGCALAGVPLVVHFHGFDIYMNEVLQENKTSYQHLFRHAGGFIVGARDMQAHAISLGVPEARLHYNPCGVDGSRFAPVQAGSNPPRIISIGRFVDKKAPYLTLLAFKMAKEKCPEAQLVMAGEGAVLEACRQIARACHLIESVRVVGRQTHQEVAALLRTGRAFAQHSLRTTQGDSEGTAISILEASATALPVIATSHAGIKDTMVHGETALLCSEGDIDTMARHMVALLTDPDLATRMGSAGRTRVIEHFSMEKSIQGIYRILETVYGARSAMPTQ